MNNIQILIHCVFQYNKLLLDLVIWEVLKLKLSEKFIFLKFLLVD